ncbi:MAG: RluA family pseudouridine synthase [Firmicutes bacterium]|nr:RluA family pseudouridine synthase [Bacillota bacterium]
MTGDDYRVTAADAGTRLDVYITGLNPDLSRSYVQKLIGGGLVRVNGGVDRASYRVRAGDEVRVTVPPPVQLAVRAEAIPLDVCHEDHDLIVVNKPRGMVVHPAEGNMTGTLVNALLHHCRDLSGINGVLRPGIVHRIDKDTSGLLMAAKNDFAHEGLAAQLKEHTVIRGYVALVHGVVKNDRGMVDAPVGRHPADRLKMAVNTRSGKKAVTHYRVLDRRRNYTLLDLRLETGRTHQIRVHMNHIGHPLAGDARYGPKRPGLGLEGQFLHAYLLGFVHPRTGEKMKFGAPLPGELEHILSRATGMQFLLLD